MTDIRSALVGATARASSTNDRSALANGEDQAGFDQALLGESKPEAKPHDKRIDTDGSRDKRWLKLVERLGTKTVDGSDDPKSEVDNHASPGDADLASLELPVLEQETADAPKHEQAAETALPLVLALSELRKVASQPANTNAAASEQGDATEPAGSTGLLKSQADGTDNPPPRTPAGIKLPEGMKTTLGEETLAKVEPETGNPSASSASEAEKPARTAARQVDHAPQTARVNVISEQAMPAPAAGSASATATTLAMDIASAAPRHTAAATAVQQLQASATNTPAAHSLKIQLRPVELGMVTANLHLAGTQLTVEIEVESAEAYHRLSADREAITSALKGLGFDVDHVTIQAPPSNPATNARADGSPPQTGPGGREQQAFQSGGPGSDSANSGNRQTSRGAASEDNSTRNISSSGPASSGGSLYI